MQTTRSALQYDALSTTAPPRGSLLGTDASVGVWQTFVVLAAVYFVFMVAGAFSYRVPPTGWRTEGFAPPDASKATMITGEMFISPTPTRRRSFG